MAFRLGDAAVFFGADSTDLDSKIEGSQGKMSSFGSKASALIGGAVVTAAAAAAAAIAAVGVAAFSVSQDTETAARQIEASLGLSRAEAERLAEAARGVFGQNFANSVTEAGEAVALLVQHIEGVAGQEEALTAKAFAISDAFGPPIEEVIAAVSVLTEEFEGLDPTQAFDLVAAGFQKGLDKSGDFLDSIGEYSGLFGDAKFGADEFFSVLETGQAGGVLGTDKIADAVKEFQIRVAEGSEDVGDAMHALGLSYAEIEDDLATGEQSMADVFATVVEKLNEIDDPLERNRAAVALFGTQAEDLGVNFTQGLSMAQTSLEDMAGAADSLNAQYDTLGGALGAIWRELIVEVSPLTDLLLDLAHRAIPLVRVGAQWLGDVLSGEVGPGLEGVIKWLKTLEPLWAIMRDAVDHVKDSLRLVVQLLKGDFAGAWETVQGIVKRIIDTWGTLIGDAVAAIGASFNEVDWAATGEAIWKKAKTGLESALTTAGKALAGLSGWIGGWFSGLDWATAGTSIWKLALSGLETALMTAGKALAGLAGWVGGWFSGLDWATAGTSIWKLALSGLETALMTAGKALAGLSGWIGGWFSGLDWATAGTSIWKLALSGLETALMTAGKALAGLAGWVGGWFSGLDWATAGTSIWKLALSGLETALMTAGKALAGLSGWIGGWFSGLDWATAGTSIWKLALSGLETALMTAGKALAGLAGWIGGWFSGLDWATAGTSIWKLALSGLETALATASSALSGLGGWIGGWFTSLDWAAAGSAIWSLATSGLEIALTTAGKALSGLAGWVHAGAGLRRWTGPRRGRRSGAWRRAGWRRRF